MKSCSLQLLSSYVFYSCQHCGILLDTITILFLTSVIVQFAQNQSRTDTAAMRRRLFLDPLCSLWLLSKRKHKPVELVKVNSTIKTSQSVFLSFLPLSRSSFIILSARKHSSQWVSANAMPLYICPHLTLFTPAPVLFTRHRFSRVLPVTAFLVKSRPHSSCQIRCPFNSY